MSLAKPSRRKSWLLFGGLGLLLLLTGLPLGFWATLTHRPTFYRALVDQPKEQVEAAAKRFVADSLQLRNDIVNEPNWEAVFSDKEVNAWLAEELVTHFADQLPPEVHDPRIAFENDRVTLAFGLDQGPVRSVIWIVAKAAIPEDNVVSFTLEKIRAGVLPVPADRIIQTITAQAEKNGLDISWSRDGDLHVATIRYKTDRGRTDVVLERVQLRDGQIKIGGRSNHEVAAAPTLPKRQVLQLNFPKRKLQPEPPPADAAPEAVTPSLPPSPIPDPVPTEDRTNSSGPVH